MQRFIKSLIPLLLSYYTIKYYQEFYPAKVKVNSSEANPLEANGIFNNYSFNINMIFVHMSS